MNLMPLGLLAETQSAIAPQRRPATILDPVADFGAVGDGATDNADALMAMRQYIADRWDRHFEVHFPPGHYAYSKNVWLNGVGSVTINGNGSRFECTASSSNDSVERSFYTRAFYDDAPATELEAFSGAGRVTGCPQARFERATAGSTVLTLKPEISGQPYLAVKDIAEGDRVFLWAFDQQFINYPPNIRYFEWNKVVSVDTGAGTVTLRSPLQFDYEENLPDDDQWDDVWYGKARLLKLDRPSGYRYPRYIELSNLIMEPNRNALGNDNGLQIIADHFVADNVRNESGYLWLGFNRFAEIKNSSFWRTDIDKLGGKVRIRSCAFETGFGPASGILDMDVEDCTFGGDINLCARRNRVVGNRVGYNDEWGAIRLASITSLKRFVVQDNVIVPTGNLNFAIGTNVPRDFSPDAVSGRDVILDDTSSVQADIIRKIDVGAKLIRGSQAGEITRIWYDDTVSQWHIETTFESIATTDTLRFYLGQDLIYSGNEVVNQSTWLLRDFVLAFKSGPIDLVVPNDLKSETPKLYGFVSKFEVRVIRPQQNVTAENPDPIFVAYIKDETGTNVAELNVDVTQTGVVSTGVAGDVVVGGANSVVSTSLPSNQFVSGMWLEALKSSGNSGWEGDDADKPIVSLRIEGQSIL